MAELTWLEGNRIRIAPPRRTKKITGTRFAALLGLSPWATEFEIWCAVTRTYERPFEDTIYTLAGKTIEPKQAEYLKKSYGMGLISPADRYGADYFNKTRGDFFPEYYLMGGMWDYLGVDERGDVNAVIECKTTKRIEDWREDVPEYYALQAALYAWLLDVDNVIMVASFLDGKDYANPDGFVPSIGNTITVGFRVSERYPDFAEKVARAERWWTEHVKTGISPPYDEKKDADILKALRTNSLAPDAEIAALVAEAEAIKAEVDRANAAIADREKRLREINERIREHAVALLRPGDGQVEIRGTAYTWTLTRSEAASIDERKLEEDGLLERYQTRTERYRMTITRGGR